MPRQAVTMETFRRRLRQLIAEQYEGKYTLFAKRAGLPVSTVEHYLHVAVRLPGGEQLVRMADALGVSLDFLVTGSEPTQPAELLSASAPLPRSQRDPRQAGDERHLVVPVFRCGCPGSCPLTGPATPPEVAGSRLAVPVDLVGERAFHRLVGLQVEAALASDAMPPGTRLVIDRSNTQPQWEAVALLHLEGRCCLAHCTVAGAQLLIAASLQAPPRVVPRKGTILGRVIAAFMPWR